MRRIGSAAVAAVLSVALAGCWFQPGNGAGRSYSNDETTITAANVSGLDVLWDADLAGNRSPVSVNGTIYTSNGTKVFALNATTGAVKWQAGPFLIEGSEDIFVTFGELLYVDGEVVASAATGFASFDSGGVYRFNAQTGASTFVNRGTGSSYNVAEVGGEVAERWTDVVGSSGFGVTGIKWAFEPMVIHSGGGSGPQPGGFAFVGDRILWSYGNLATGYSAACPTNPWANAGCGPDWQTDLGAKPIGPARIDDTTAVYADAGGTVSVLDATTGAIEWTGETGSVVTTRPAVDGDTILVGTFDGRVVAFPADGCGAATCAPLWDVAVGDVPNRSLVIGGEVAYATTNNGNLVAFASGGCGAATCPVLKTIAANAITGDSIVVDAGRVLVPTGGGHLVAYGLPG